MPRGLKTRGEGCGSSTEVQTGWGLGDLEFGRAGWLDRIRAGGTERRRRRSWSVVGAPARFRRARGPRHAGGASLRQGREHATRRTPLPGACARTPHAPRRVHFRMTFRGTYRGGVIIPGGSLDLPEGARVDFSILRSSAPSEKKKPRPGVQRASKRPPARMSAAQRVEAFMQGFGILRDAPECKGKSSAAIARDLRRRATGARFRG